jgi:hypothetical protein
MMADVVSLRPKSVFIKYCFRDLFERLEATAIEHDPAPWHKVYVHGSVDDSAAFVRQQKLQDRLKRVLQVGLLIGALRAHYSDNLETCDIPGWAWEGAEKNDNVLSTGRLELSVFLPEPWQRWSGELVFLDQDAFLNWVDAQDLNDTASLVELPRPQDVETKPVPITERQPSDASFVTLSEALSWIAFGVALDHMALDREANVLQSLFGSINSQQQALEEATFKLISKASGGHITVRGKFVEAHPEDAEQVDTKEIEPVRFEDFAQFDILHDGLRRGGGLTWYDDHSMSDRHHDCDGTKLFASVKVNRAELLELFPLADEEPFGRGIQASNTSMPSHDYIVQWCRDWIAEGKGNGMDKAWPAFNNDSRHMCVTRDDVFRPAWSEAKTKLN